MKFSNLLIVLSVFLFASSAFATPFDLSTFGAIDPADPVFVDDKSNNIEIMEDPFLSAVYFFNDNFAVSSGASIFSFDYNFQLGDDDYNDYFMFELNFGSELLVETSGSGHFEIDLTPYQDTEVSLAWGLFWDGDYAAGSSVVISNVDILDASQTAPVPEPATILLLGSGFIGLAGFGRKKMAKS